MSSASEDIATSDGEGAAAPDTAPTNEAETDAEAEAEAEADPSTLDPQPLSTASTSLRSLVQKAQQLFDETYFCPSSPICAVAPGRVNLM